MPAIIPAKGGAPEATAIPRHSGRATSATTIDAAHDATRVDPGHYTVEFENERVRVLRIKYGPYARSVMHEHPDSVLVFMTEGRAKFNFPDGSTEEINARTKEPGHHAAVLRALVLCPTRELALQVCKMLKALADPLRVLVVPIVVRAGAGGGKPVV